MSAFTWSRTVATGKAACGGCDWRRSYNTLRNQRAAAHRHVVRTGHRVSVEVTKRYTYGPRP